MVNIYPFQLLYIPSNMFPFNFMSFFYKLSSIKSAHMLMNMGPSIGAWKNYQWPYSQ